ncbi:YciI family protein [Microbulbifer variabilis]|uniref:YciI family protein n=1 Tax=Microbulbifer variabilis TaxID=266805 RepID=UPI001CFC8591|nr:YciI family protein [Microbulbifer variabilis]
MFIVSLTYKAELAEVDKHIEGHVAFLEKYYASGNFIASGRKVPRTGGVILVQAGNLNEVQKIIQEDPFHIADLVNYEITEFIPTMASKEFESLKNCI